MLLDLIFQPPYPKLCLNWSILILRYLSSLIRPTANAKSLQSCPTLCDPIDGSPPGSPVPGILQARTLEWFAISFSDAWKWKVKGKSLSHVRLLATPWTTAHRAPPSMGFSRQEYWGGVPSPSPVLTLEELKKIHKKPRLTDTYSIWLLPVYLGFHERSYDGVMKKGNRFLKVIPLKHRQEMEIDIFLIPR